MAVCVAGDDPHSQEARRETQTTGYLARLDCWVERFDLSTLTEAIYFHGGAARASRDAFFALPPQDQAKVIEFLKSLQVRTVPQSTTTSTLRR
ncbi:MAG: hypothetical protein JNK25_03005 [Phycisphaerae bacterium]|nr:hypothetical protein [Phycisphaerae bacterium]